MIKTIGFESSRLLSVTDDINEWLETTTNKNSGNFRLIDIKFAATAEAIPKGRQHVDVNYSALVLYELQSEKRRRSNPLAAVVDH
jgi:hypothetical protein